MSIPGGWKTAHGQQSCASVVNANNKRAVWNPGLTSRDEKSGSVNEEQSIGDTADGVVGEQEPISLVGVAPIPHPRAATIAPLLLTQLQQQFTNPKLLPPPPFHLPPFNKPFLHPFFTPPFPMMMPFPTSSLGPVLLLAATAQRQLANAARLRAAATPVSTASRIFIAPPQLQEQRQTYPTKNTETGKRKRRIGRDEGGDVSFKLVRRSRKVQPNDGQEANGPDEERVQHGKSNPIVEMVLADDRAPPAINFNTCAICGTSFRLTGDLVAHARSNHRQQSRYDRQHKTSIADAQRIERAMEQRPRRTNETATIEKENGME